MDSNPPTPDTPPPPAQPFEGDSLTALLKAPDSIAARMATERGLLAPSLTLLVWGLVFHAAYGIAMGFFGGWDAAVMAAVKSPLIVVCALALCFPSLYVFSCVAGMAVTLAQALLLGASLVAMTGLLLIALAPVSWLFAVSTESLAFAVVLNVSIWLLCIGFSVRVFRGLSLLDPVHHAAGAKWWLFIYVLVSLQMATTMRPLLGVGEDGWWTPGKKFFLTHFTESINPHQGRTSSGR